MQTSKGHLTYCSNIHAGESWPDHFNRLQENIPLIKAEISPIAPFGIGLRLSNMASLELRKEPALKEFQDWLSQNNCYVFTMNGFPYGGFHHTVVKDQVHAPDWRSADRVAYTIRLAQILAALLPDEIDGGISTSPLSYKFWHEASALPEVYEQCTLNLLQVVDQLVAIKKSTGKAIHIDIEPEPDGLLGDGKEFLQWYVEYLIPIGATYLQERHQCNEDVAAAMIREHIQICYDVCHFAVNYEDHAHMIAELKALGIKTGKIQISAALKAPFTEEIHQRDAVLQAFSQFNEPVYLHQVVEKTTDGSLVHYPDLQQALDHQAAGAMEWRAHYHVPLFVEHYGVLQSTRGDIIRVLALHDLDPFTFHLEIETYTWEVLPLELRVPIAESIIREIKWVISVLNHQSELQRHA